MPCHDLSYGGIYDSHKGMPKDLVRSLRYLPLTAEPRTLFQYCNMMFVVISHVIEPLEGTWLGDFLFKRIWEPLHMKSIVGL
jgi:CubicO group peptidase (beta-lactamase class C family)